ncbi:hypothetical protein HK105_207966 [Polyrhizophydium stewartii]|uniref:Fungal lipase-type domain-containing protein n=1 Tax=Polyrhizophydium stewartii TaxID=2732419 RepID=A0ABR4MZ51_9FUNG
MFPSFILAISAAVAGFGGGAAAAQLSASQVATLTKFRQFAAVSRCDVVTINGQWTCGPSCQGATAGTTVFKTFNGGDTGTGLVAVQPSSKSIVVIFRGSKTPADWFKNLNFGLDSASWLQASWAVPANLGNRLTGARLAIPSDLKIHSGFQEIYLGVRNTVQTAITDALAKNPGFSVNFVGHSLGGALASFAAVDYLNLHGTSNAANTFIYTYGQPRAGNTAWANYFSSLPFASVSRVTRQQDIVPHLPPTSFSYRHTKQEFGILADGSVVSCTNTGNAGEVSDCSNLNYNPLDIDFNLHTNGYFFTPAAIPFHRWGNKS